MSAVGFGSTLSSDVLGPVVAHLRERVVANVQHPARVVLVAGHGEVPGQLQVGARHSGLFEPRENVGVKPAPQLHARLVARLVVAQRREHG